MYSILSFDYNVDYLKGNKNSAKLEDIVMPEQKIQELKTQEVHKIFQSKSSAHAFLDLRRPDELNKGVIPGALTIRLHDLGAELPRLDADKTYVLVCHQGFRSEMGCQEMLKAGFKVINYVDGMADWYAQNLPLEYPNP